MCSTVAVFVIVKESSLFIIFRFVRSSVSLELVFPFFSNFLIIFIFLCPECAPITNHFFSFLFFCFAFTYFSVVFSTRMLYVYVFVLRDFDRWNFSFCRVRLDDFFISSFLFIYVWWFTSFYGPSYAILSSSLSNVKTHVLLPCLHIAYHFFTHAYTADPLFWCKYFY